MDGKRLKSVREALKLSQEELAPLLNRCLSSLRNYEWGHRIPEEIAQKVEALAAERGIGIFPLDSQINPSHTTSTGTFGSEGAALRSGGDANARWHSALDEILNSGIEEAITAVQSNLVVFGNYVRAKFPRPKAEERRKA
jgi:transcriptional regulator with XRE-family HTH domain